MAAKWTKRSQCQLASANPFAATLRPSTCHEARGPKMTKRTHTLCGPLIWRIQLNRQGLESFRNKPSSSNVLIPGKFLSIPHAGCLYDHVVLSKGTERTHPADLAERPWFSVAEGLNSPVAFLTKRSQILLSSSFQVVPFVLACGGTSASGKAGNGQNEPNRAPASNGRARLMGRPVVFATWRCANFNPVPTWRLLSRGGSRADSCRKLTGSHSPLDPS